MNDKMTVDNAKAFVEATADTYKQEINELQTKLAESEARVSSLVEQAGLVISETDSHAYIGSTARDVVEGLYYKDLKVLVKEAPAQSLQHIEAAAVEKYGEYKASQLVKGLPYLEPIEYVAQIFGSKLRQQQTNGE